MLKITCFQIADVSTNEVSTMPIEENFFRSEGTSGVQDDILIDAGQFKTDGKVPLTYV